MSFSTLATYYSQAFFRSWEQAVSWITSWSIIPSVIFAICLGVVEFWLFNNNIDRRSASMIVRHALRLAYALALFGVIMTAAAFVQDAPRQNEALNQRLAQYEPLEHPVEVPSLNSLKRSQVEIALRKLAEIMNNKEKPATTKALAVTNAIPGAGNDLNKLTSYIDQLQTTRKLAREVMESFFDTALPDPVVREIITQQALQGKDRDTIINFHAYCDRVYDGLIVLQKIEQTPNTASAVPGFLDLLSERVNHLRDYAFKAQALVDKINIRISQIEQSL